MKPFIRTALEWVLPVPILHYRAYRDLILNQSSYLYSTGWMQSLKERKPVDLKGNLVPWMNFPIVRLLEERLRDDLNLFEFGSGYSTLFYADNVKTVTSVEYDQQWFDAIESQVPQNVNLIFKDKDIDGDYCRVIGAMEEQYDIVIIDGRDRVNCIKQSVSTLSSRGVMILDDSQRSHYREGIEHAKRCGFKSLCFQGLKAIGSEEVRTTIFYREQNCLEI